MHAARTRRRPLALFSLLASALLAPVGAAGVLVVDAANGPGTDFTDLQTAVTAASDGDVLLVRSGTYGFLTIDGKALVVQADDGASVLVDQGIQVFNVAAGTLAIRGIDVGAAQAGSSLVVSHSSGSVWIEDMEIAGTAPGIPFPGGGVRVTNCASVLLARCVVHPFENQFLDPGLAVTESNVTLHETTVNGPKGFDQVFAPNSGGIGLRLVSSTVDGTGATIVGGAGGNFVGSPGSCAVGGTGGTGLAASAGSSVTLYGSTIAGGPGGTTFAPCATGATGPVADVDGSSSLTTAPQALGTMVLSSPVRAGNSYTLDVTGGEPNAALLVLYALTSFPALPASAYQGVLHVSPFPFQFAVLGNLSGAGAFNAGFSVGAGVSSVVVYTQPLTVSVVDATVRLGGATLLTVLAAGL